MQAPLPISERRACRVLQQPRTSQRYAKRRADDEEALSARSVALASRFGRYGYRRITALLRQEGVAVNELFAFIDEGLRTEYDDAIEWYPYDSEEKALVGNWSDSYEVADEVIDLTGVLALPSLFDDSVRHLREKVFCFVNLPKPSPSQSRRTGRNTSSMSRHRS